MIHKVAVMRRAVLQGSLLGSGSDLGPLSLLLLDLVKSGTNDVPLDLHDPPGLLLVHLVRGALLVDAPVHLRPLYLTRVALPQESLLAFGINEDECLHVRASITPAMAWVDLVAREVANFGPSGGERIMAIIALQPFN